MAFQIYGEFVEKVERVGKMKISDEKFDLNKEYEFNYEKLNQDPRLKELSPHRKWMDKLIGLHGCNVLVVSEDSATVLGDDNRTFMIARRWCDEI